MTDTIQEKKPIEYYQGRPELYRMLENGTVWEIATRRICATYPALNPYAITAEKSREFAHQRRAQKARSTLKGLADITANGLDVDAMNDDELIAAAGDTVRALTRHMGEQFLESKNVRGLSEAYNKLLESLSADEKTSTPPGALPPGMVGASVDTLLELVEQIEQHKRLRLDAERAVNVELEG